MNTASKKQLNIIHVLANKVFKDDESYRAALMGFGVQSSKDLVIHDATKFINTMMKLVDPKGTEYAKRKKLEARGKRGFQQHLTQLQADRIDILVKLLKWDANRLIGFINRQTGKLKAPAMLANYEATRVIVGLEKILSNNNHETFLSINKMNNAELEKCL